MPKVLHLLEHLEDNVTTRAILSLAKSSTKLFGHEHQIITLGNASPEMVAMASAAGIDTHVSPNQPEIDKMIVSADILQIEYVNSPALLELLHRPMPATRLAIWCHVTGHQAPQMIPQAMGSMADVCIASAHSTIDGNPVFNIKLPDEPSERNALVLAPADFDRVKNIQPKAHEGFNVGYMGPVSYSKMHKNFVSMSASIDIPGVHFTVCGQGVNDQLASHAHDLHAADRFTFLEMTENTASVFETMDVFGYPLCEEAYSTTESGLQEAMYAGIPAVVFPHGSLKGLIRHNETGLIVHSEEDYKRSIAFLFNNPEERRRIGLNASIYAKTHLGARNAAAGMNKVYDFMLSLPKREHIWGQSPYVPLNEALIVHDIPSAQLFANSLCSFGEAFQTSLNDSDIHALLSADQQIAQVSAMIYEEGLSRYVQFDESDAHIRMWNGLYLEEQEAFPQAIQEYAASIEAGLMDWRVQWYLGRALQKLGKTEEARRIYLALRNHIEAFDEITGDTSFQEAARAPLQFSIPGTTAQPAPESAIQFQSTTMSESEELETPQAKPNPIRVSAIVSTYASEAFIDGCLHNLVSQSLFQKGELEIIVIDANSPEDEKSVVTRYQDNFDNIQYVRTPEREPLYVSWNRGIKIARGDYVTSANTDDRHRKDALELMANYLDAHPEFALLYAGQIDTSVPNESFETTSSVKMLNWPHYSYAELERHCIVGSQPMWRKSMHEKYGYFREDLISAADYEFWLRIGRHETFYRYPETLGLYYRNPEGIEHGSTTSEQETLKIWQEYGMFERGIPVILNGRVISQAQVPQFSAPDHTSIPERPTFDVYVKEFEKAFNMQDFDQALAVAESALYDYKDLPYPGVLKAIVLRQKQLYADALASLEQSILLDETPEALLELIQLSMATGQAEEAQRTAAYIKQKYPEWQERVEMLNESLLQDNTAEVSEPAKLDDLEYSVASFDELKNQFENFLKGKEMVRAEELAQAAIRKFPDNHEAWVLKATSDRIKGSFLEAREAIHKSLLIEDCPEALIELFQVSQALGDDKEAKNIATMFEVAYPEHSDKFRELFPDALD